MKWIILFLLQSWLVWNASAELAVEPRGVWLHPATDFSADPATGKKQVHDFVTRMAEANFNFLLPWVTSDYLMTTMEATNRWDVVGELIQAAHERGMPVQLWYSFTYYKTAGSPDFDPHFGGNPDWAAKRLDANHQPTAPMTDVCPLHPEARQWELNLILRVLDRYTNAAGIHIEEPGYGYADNCACALCRSLLDKTYGPGKVTNLNGAEAEDLKCLGTTDFMRQLQEALRARKTKLVFSTNGGSDWRGDRTLGRDWRHWSELGWLDYYAAQIYTPDLNTFSSLAKTVVNDLPKTPVYAGIGVAWSGGATPLPEILSEIDLVRKQGAKGIVLFSGKTLTDEILAALKKGPFQKATAYH